jgi:hypothetical protein
MTIIKHLTTAVLSCAVASLVAAAAYAEENYCIAVNGGFGGGGSTFIGKGFAVPSAGNCTPWSGFTKTAGTVILTTNGTGCTSSNGKVVTISVFSTDPSWFGPGQSGSDYIQFCPKGVSGCPLSSGEDVGSLSGPAKPETCTTSLLNLPATHD